HAPHDAIAPFAQDHAIPVVQTAPAALLQFVDARHAILQSHPASQCPDMLVGQFADDAYGVFALDFEARMHQAVRQFAGGREDQQAGGVVVEPPHRQPFAASHRRQLLEHARAALWVVMADDLALRLVIQDDARQLGVIAHRDLPATHANDIARLHAHADLRRIAVYSHLALANQSLHFAPRAQPRLREDLVDLLGNTGLGAVRIFAFRLPGPSAPGGRTSQRRRRTTRRGRSWARHAKGMRRIRLVDFDQLRKLTCKAAQCSGAINLESMGNSESAGNPNDSRLADPQAK